MSYHLPLSDPGDVKGFHLPLNGKAAERLFPITEHVHLYVWMRSALTEEPRTMWWMLVIGEAMELRITIPHEFGATTMRSVEVQYELFQPNGNHLYVRVTLEQQPSLWMRMLVALVALKELPMSESVFAAIGDEYRVALEWLNKGHSL